LEIVLTALATRGPAAEDSGTERAEAAQQLMDEHLFAQILGEGEAAPTVEVPLQDPASAGIEGLPEGTLAVADLRTAPVGARVDLIEVEVPGDPLETHVAWSARGRVVAVLGGRARSRPSTHPCRPRDGESSPWSVPRRPITVGPTAGAGTAGAGEEQGDRRGMSGFWGADTDALRT